MPRRREIKELRIGTRRSALAMAQSRIVADALRALHGGLEVQLVPILTSGDRQAGPLAPIGGKGLFTAELEEALRRGEIHLAVHSAKDMPAQMADEFTIAAALAREDPRDALVSQSGGGVEDLPAGASVGTSSLRRRAQLLAVRGDLNVVSIRGNVATRLAKALDAVRREVDAVLVAMAGLKRTGLDKTRARRIRALEIQQFIPAAGQGTLVAQTLTAAEDVKAILAPLDDEASRAALEAEREILRQIGADCHSCIAVYLARSAGAWQGLAMAARSDGGEMVRLEESAPTADAAAAKLLRAMRNARLERLIKH
ncbi:MAG: hydroxymethylbilane synthase [Phycisphaerae bacterium]|nr:hydroxymethylbilane synthase [Phycisphaerae bacterium]